MNLHLIFSLLDIVGWIGIILLCNFVSLITRRKVNSISKLNTIIITLLVAPFAGLFSVLMNGFPDVGLSINSFIYVFLVSFSIVYYQQIKTKKAYLPKISKRNRKLAYVQSI